MILKLLLNHKILIKNNKSIDEKVEGDQNKMPPPSKGWGHFEVIILLQYKYYNELYLSWKVKNTII